MPRLTLRTLLAYLDDTLPAAETRSLGLKVAESEEARELIERIKRVTRRRALAAPVYTDPDDETADPNTVAEYLDNTLDPYTLNQVEQTCLNADVHLAEVAACHQILTLVLTEPVRVPPRAHQKMYGLVESPASFVNRVPNKTLPVGGAQLTGAEQAEADDEEAALLLGMQRFSSTTTWRTLFTIGGATAVLIAFLALTVLMAHPSQPQNPPETTPGHSLASLTVPVEPSAGKPKDAEPKPKDKTPDEVAPPKPKDPDPVVVRMSDPRPYDLSQITPVDPGPGLGDPVAAPLLDVRPIAKVETARVLVLTQVNAEAPWLRRKIKGDDDDTVFSNTTVMALPGYKANVLVGERDKQVQLHLWGNVPEQLPCRLFESRVKLHPPAGGFDVDITLLAGRIYLTTKKPTGAKVRVRIAAEVWDITLPNEKTDVLVEVIHWFEPGTPYARTEGTAPRLEARVAVVGETASFAAPARFKKFEKVPQGTCIAWDSTSGTLTDIMPIQNVKEADRVPASDVKTQKILTRILEDTADKVTEPNLTRSEINARLEPPTGTLDRDLVVRLAIYSQVAFVDGSSRNSKMLEPLVDILKSDVRPWQQRQAIITAFAAWVARDRANTAILRGVLLGKGLGEDKDAEDAADRLLRLLRGFVSPLTPNPTRLDELVKLFDDAAMSVRDAALWNLVAVDLSSWVPPPSGSNGPPASAEDYKKFTMAWATKVEAIKKRTLPKKP